MQADAYSGYYASNNRTREGSESFSSPPPQRINLQPPPHGGAHDNTMYEMQRDMRSSYQGQQVMADESDSHRPVHSVNVDEPVGLAGIGVLLERSGSRSATTIRGIQPLSAADREGTLKLGDEILAVNGTAITNWELSKVKRVLIGRNGEACVLTVRQKGTQGATDVTVMRGCLEWWELHDRVSLTEQQLSESENSAQEFKRMWMSESKRAGSETLRNEELSIELEGYRSALSSTRNALRVADDELAKEYAKTSEMSRQILSLQGKLAEAANRQQFHIKEQEETLDDCKKAESQREEAETGIRKLRQEIEDLRRQVLGAEEERDLSHRMYREVDFARKTAMQRLADAQGSLALLTSDNEALQKDLLRVQEDSNRERGLRSQTEEELAATRRSAAITKKIAQEKEALSDDVVRLQFMLSEKETQLKNNLDKLSQLTSSLSEASAIATESEGIKASLSREVESLRRRAEVSEKAAAEAEKHADAKVNEMQMSLHQLKEHVSDVELKHADEVAELVLKIKEMEAVIKRSEKELEAVSNESKAAKDLLVAYRAKIEDLQDGIKSRDAEVKRLTDSRDALLEACAVSKEELEKQRSKFEERLLGSQQELTNKMLASQQQHEAEQNKFYGTVKDLNEKLSVLKLEQMHDKGKYEENLNAKDLEIEQLTQSLKEMESKVDDRVQKKCADLQKQMRELVEQLQEKLQSLLEEKEKGEKAYQILFAKQKGDLQERVDQFIRDQDDLNSQWSKRLEDATKEADADKKRLMESNNRIVKNLEDQVKKEQDEHVKIIQSIPEKVNRECAALTDDINRYKKELVSLQENLKKLEDLAVQNALQDFQQEKAKRMHDHEMALRGLQEELESARQGAESEKAKMLRAHETALEVAQREKAQLLQKHAQELQDQNALQGKTSSEALKAAQTALRESEQKREALQRQFDATKSELTQEHARAIQDMQRQKADALMKTANECKDQLLQKEIDHNMKVAKMIQELKDQLSKEKIKIIEEKSATERDLREKAVAYKEERDHIKTEMDRFYKLPNPVGLGLVLKIVKANEQDNIRGAVVIEKTVPGLSGELSGSCRAGMLLLEVDHHNTSQMDIDEVRDRFGGKRGSKIVLRLQDDPKLGANGYNKGRPFNIILKRGSWGPEHAVLEPEDRDMIDAGSWPVLSDKDRFAEQSFQGWQRDSQTVPVEPNAKGTVGNSRPSSSGQLGAV